MTPLESAQDEHTNALRAWLSSRGDDEPAALARLDQARARLRDAFSRELARRNRAIHRAPGRTFW